MNALGNGRLATAATRVKAAIRRSIDAVRRSLYRIVHSDPDGIICSGANCVGVDRWSKGRDADQGIHRLAAIERELEGWAACVDSSLLSIRSGIPGTGRKGIWDGGAARSFSDVFICCREPRAQGSSRVRGRGSWKGTDRLTEMSQITLQPNTYIALLYSAEDDDVVVLDVKSDTAVKTYIVRPKGLDLYKEGSSTFKYYGGFPDPRKEQFQELLLPFAGNWYLIISNPSKSSIARVHYEVRISS